MEIKSLRYFLAMAREEDLSRAAKTLKVSPRAVKKALKELEEDFDQPLFVKNRRQVTLTPTGIVLEQRATEILDLVAKTTEEINTDEEVAGPVHLACGETAMVRQVADVMKALQEKYPRLTLNLESGDGDFVRKRLDQGNADFGLIFGPVDRTKYDQLDLSRADSWGALVPSDHLLAQQPFLTPRDLWDEPLILSKPAIISGFLQEWLRKDVNDLNVVATYTLVLNAAKLVASGMGIALSLNGLVNEPGVTFVPLSPALDVTGALIWKKYQVFSPAAQSFLEAMEKQFAN